MSSKLGLVSRIVRENARYFTTSEARCKVNLEKLRKKQQLIQGASGPIHLRGGKYHFYATSALGVVVLVLTGQSIYRLVSHF